MLQQAERRWGWDSNPGLSGPSTCSLHSSVPGRWGHISALGRKPEKKEGFLGTATKAPPQHQTPRQAPAHLDPPAGPWASEPSTQPRAHWCPMTNCQHTAPRPRQYHSPRRPRSSCPCRSCGSSGDPRPQAAPAGAAAHCPGRHPPSPGLAMAPKTQNTGRGLSWGFATHRGDMSHHEGPFCT